VAQHEAHKLAISAKQSPAKKSAIKKLTAKGKIGSPKYMEHRGRKVAAAGGGIPPIPTAPHILGALPGQGLEITPKKFPHSPSESQDYFSF